MAKIFVLLALLITLSVNAATAVTDESLLSCPPMMASMSMMEPCRQYMLQELMMSMAVGDVSPAMLVAPHHYQLPSPVLRQQCCIQLQGMMPRCQCNAMCQMIQLVQQDLIAAYPAAAIERKMMMMRLREMAMRMPYMCGTTPTYCQLFPGGGC